LAAFVWLVFGASGASAYSPLTASCIERSAKFVGVDELALWVILRTEGGYLGSVHRNTDGSDDLGPFQINSRTLLSLAARLDLSYEQLVRMARDEGCPAVFLAGFILREKIAGRTGTDLWNGLADYNSKMPEPHRRYLARLRKSYYALTQQAPPKTTVR
jgi:hypothetical protein